MTFDEKTRRLTPAEGLWITQKEIVDESKRSFSQLMYLGINDAPSNYTEWTQEQWKEWQDEYNPAPELPEPVESVEQPTE